MKINKHLIYPCTIVITLFILTILNINGSSIGIYNQLFFNGEQNSSILFGVNRAIRSDEYIVGTPILISQDINNEPLVNKDIGEGQNVGTNSFPINYAFSWLRPATWLFFLSNNSELSFSFYWYTRFVLLIISAYLLLLELTKKNITISIIGSLLFFFTPFVQWWISVDMVYPIFFGLFFFIRLLKEKNIKYRILYGLGLLYCIVSFVLSLYPPFQIPMMYISIFIALGIILKNRKRLLKDKEQIKKIVLILIGIVIITAGLLLSFFKQFESVIQITMNTVYPGARFISSGGGSLYQLVDGFYNILMQKDSNGAPFANQSEASNFFLLFMPLLIWSIYKNISMYIKSKKIDILGICISLCLIFFMIFYFIPLPNVISKYTLMYLVPPTRMWIGIGFMNYILIFYMLSKDMYKVEKNNKIDILLLGVISILTGLLMYKTGQYLYELNPQSFSWPTIVSPEIKILMVTLFVPTLLITFLLGYKKIFLALFISFAIASTIYVNPINKGLDILINTELANYTTEVSEKDDSKWIIYGDSALAQYALANNASILNGVHIYPQFRIWEIIDPTGEYIDIYNRYAHISVSEYIDEEELVVLLAPDAIELNINPCDEKLTELNVKYVLTRENLKDTTCLTEMKTIDDMKIYQRN